MLLLIYLSNEQERIKVDIINIRYSYENYNYKKKR